MEIIVAEIAGHGQQKLLFSARERAMLLHCQTCQVSETWQVFKKVMRSTQKSFDGFC